MSAIVGYETEHDSDEGLASRILRVLVEAYPAHGWFVLIRGGVIQVKNLDWHPNWGMALHYTQVTSDSKVMAQEVRRAAGEFLERANVARGANTGERVTHIEGIPDKHLARAGL